MLKKTYYIFLISALLCVGNSFAQSTKPIIDAKMNPDSVAIGDQFNLEVTIDKDIVQIVEFPQFNNQKLGEQIEILSESNVDTVSNEGRRVKLRKNYLLTIFDEGVYSLGKFPMLYVDKNIVDTIWSRDSIFLKVATFEIDTTKQTIFDIKPQMKTPLKFGEISGYLLWGILICGIIALIIIYIMRRIANKPLLSGKKEAALPPHVVAITALEELRNQKIWQSNKHKLYYTRLTDIIRVYLEGRYGVSAMEMTSDEILDSLKEAGLSAKSHSELKTLLKSADLVKFAKLTPDAEQNENAYLNAYYFVEESKPTLVEEPSKEIE